MEKNKNEIWKWISRFEGVYQISNYGRIKSFKRLSHGFILSLKRNGNHYINYCFRKKGLTVYAKVHRVVAETFIPNPYSKPHVNHKNGIKKDNRVSNLEWCSPSENMQHAIINGLANYKEMNWYNQNVKPKKIIQKDLNGKILNIYTNGSEASKATGVCHRNILQVASKDEYKPGLTRKQAGGFLWEFLYEY